MKNKSFSKQTVIIIDYPYLPKLQSEWFDETYNKTECDQFFLPNNSFIHISKKDIVNTPLYELIKEEDLSNVDSIIIKYWW